RCRRLLEHRRTAFDRFLRRGRTSAKTPKQDQHDNNARAAGNIDRPAGKVRTVAPSPLLRLESTQVRAILSVFPCGQRRRGKIRATQLDLGPASRTDDLPL